ncbi:hypothetical protein RvY_17281 [Ramazzottius varieornatus]|uniref:DDE-1 domain-containing protein n=1 Tax=Ramazzottius varieornatus TaxID=947166 RepID=A0A1D1W1L5_RAMVA|nr:hypothetical protein RvY_17281 [Ramazzottius varieornatus]
MKAQKRKIALLLDNFSAHRVGEKSNVKVVFLPRNLTSKVQPLDKGIIASYKYEQRYKAEHRRTNLYSFSNGSEYTKSINILDAVKWVLLLWNDTTQVRDDKLGHLAAHCGRLVNPFPRPEDFPMRADSRQANVGLDKVYWPTNRIHGSSSVGQNYIIFYLTEMWPGGTSAVIPAADVAQRRTLFPAAPILGGRGKCFMANQNILLNAQSTQHSSALQMRPTTTVEDKFEAMLAFIPVTANSAPSTACNLSSAWQGGNFLHGQHHIALVNLESVDSAT